MIINETSPLKAIVSIIVFISLFCSSAIVSADEAATEGKSLSVGIPVRVGELEAIGTLEGRCTAALIRNNMVLTAAHCVCAAGKKHQCRKRAIFTLHDVIPANGSQRRNVSIGGDVYVHPKYDGREERACWDEDVVDIAVIVLDAPASRFADVMPISVEEAMNIPSKGEMLTLVGFGLTGRGVESPDGGRECENPSLGKMKLRLPIYSIDEKSINFYEKGMHTCGGDSGGPALNSTSRVVGVSSCGDREYTSSYEPMYPFYDWIFNVKRVKHPPSCKTICDTGYKNCMKPNPNAGPREPRLRPMDCKPGLNFCLERCNNR